jgi:hypothetical protein
MYNSVSYRVDVVENRTPRLIQPCTYYSGTTISSRHIGMCVCLYRPEAVLVTFVSYGEKTWQSEQMV